jgi:predicted RND superfamily exporter protein
MKVSLKTGENAAQKADVSHRILTVAIHALLKYPFVVLLLFLLGVGGLGWQAQYFQIDASPDTLLTRDNPLYVQTQQVNQRYAPQEFLLVTYQPDSGEIFSPSSLEDIASISESISELSRVNSVRSILNVPVFTDNVSIDGLQGSLNELTVAGGDFDQTTLEAAFTEHPVYTDLLVNRSLNATAMQVLFESSSELLSLNEQITALNAKQMTQGELDESQRAELASLESQREPLLQSLSRQRQQEVEAIRSILEPYQARAQLHMGGVHVLSYQLIDIISQDLVVFGSAIAGMIVVLLFVLFRSFRWVLIPVLCCVCSVLPTMGLFALLDMKATVISSNFIALQLILTLAIVMHLIVDYRELAEADQTKRHQVLIEETLLRKIGPCFFAGITTSVGFGSLIFSGIQPVISFGWMMITAMFFSILVSLILFPVLVALLPSDRHHADIGWLTSIVSGFRKLVLRCPALVIIGSLVAVTAGGMGALRLSAENSFINYFSEDTEIYQELSYIDQAFGGSTPLDIVYPIPEQPDNPDLIMTAEAILKLQQIQAVLADYEATGRILSPVNLTDLAKEVNNGQPLTEYELTAIYWMMDENFRDDLLGSFFNEDRQEVRFNVWIEDLTPELDREALLTDIKSELTAIEVPPDSYQFSNLFVLYQDIMSRLVDSQVLTLGIVYVVMTFTFLLLFRSMKVALIAIVPNIISTAIIFGTMGWLGIPLDLMSVTIAAIVMGIAVDDTIHFVHRYLQERKTKSTDQAIQNCYRSVGMAVLYTSILVAGGFSMLAFSSFVPSMTFGLLTALAMLVALVADLTILPWLLTRYIRSK